MDLGELIHTLSLLHGGGLTIPESAARLRNLVRPVGAGEEARLNEAVAEYERQLGLQREMTASSMLTEDEKFVSWYHGRNPGDKYWPPYQAHLRLSQDSVAAIDRNCQSIMGRLLHPKDPNPRNVKGLVVGYVQSGKTANLLGLIATAADNGYKLFIVLSGMTKSLRWQTQKRMNGDLLFQTRGWYTLTEEHDFNEKIREIGGAVNINLQTVLHAVSVGDTRLVAVMKKNARRLERLTNWLTQFGAETLKSMPALIIDDEADQASVGDGTTAWAVNNGVREILRLLPRAAYVGFTATPFANVFIDPENPDDLYPRDFIFALPRQEGHFGAEELFGRDPAHFDLEDDEPVEGVDVVRIVPDAEARSVIPVRGQTRAFNPQLPDSLRAALQYFAMACAARIARGHTNDFMTMMVHTSEKVTAHEKVFDLVKEAQRELTQSLRQHGAAVWDELRTQWDSEARPEISTRFGLTLVDFDDIRPYILQVVSSTEMRLDNGHAPVDQRVSYEDNDPRIQLVVGGNTLSRGLTLEGLMVTYFVRSGRSYDSLLQMGRWFGYRKNYEDLVRIWMTSGLSASFRALARVEEEIRYDIKRYITEKKTPLEFRVRVRNIPGLHITGKPGRAQRYRAWFDSTFIESNRFSKETGWLRANLEEGRALWQKLRLRNPNSTEFRDVPAEIVMTFLQRYKFLREERAFQWDVLEPFFVANQRLGYYLRWNVFFMSGNGPTAENWGLSMQMSQRRVNVPGDYLDIGSIRRGGDHLADIPPVDRDRATEDWPAYRRNMNPLLLVYVVQNGYRGFDAELPALGVSAVIGRWPGQLGSEPIQYFEVLPDLPDDDSLSPEELQSEVADDDDD